MSTHVHTMVCSPSPNASSPNLRRSPQNGTPSQYALSTSSHIRSYLLPEHTRSPDLESQGLKARSPRSSSIPQFEATLTVPDYSHYPSKYSRSPSNPTPPARTLRSFVPSLAPPPRSERRNSGPTTPRNVPSHPIANDGVSIPKPILRLVGLLLVIATTAMFLARTPALQIPLLRAVNIRRDTIPSPAGYEPPQVHSVRMLDRAQATRSTRTAAAFAPHPIPSSHELLALQSYLLQSKHNTLPIGTDPTQPLDGNTILAISPSKLGRPGSAAEAKWLKELEREREEDIVIWSSANWQTEVEKMSDLLLKLHPSEKEPGLIELTGRADAMVLAKILERLGVDVKRPMVMLGNKPIYGGLEALKRMYEDESLDVEMKRIGWLDEWKAEESREADQAKMKDIKPPQQVLEAQAEAKAGADKPRIMNAGFKHE